MRPSVWRLRVKSHPDHSAPLHQVIIIIYAGRVSTDIRADQLADPWRRLRPLQVERDAARCRTIALDAVWLAAGAFARPVGAARTRRRSEVLSWTEDGLLRQMVYEGIREDKPAREVVRQWPPL